MRTETVHGSELVDRVLVPIYQERNPKFSEKLSEYRSALAKYKRRLRGHEEVTRGRYPGFVAQAYGQEVFVQRPGEPTPYGYLSFRGRRNYDGSYDRVHTGGVLAESLHNRDIRYPRVLDYAAAMQGGEWRDLFSDPITVTDDGQVINGQHRLAAAERVDWEKVAHDPLFLVVWGVDPAEALHADLSRRTDRDQAIIATKFVGVEA